MKSVLYTDAWFANAITHHVLRDRYHWTAALGWLRWTGQRWEETEDENVVESVRQYVIWRYTDATASGDEDAREGWHKMLSGARIFRTLHVARGAVVGDDDTNIGYSVLRNGGEDFDVDPWMLNTPNGLVRLDAGTVLRAHPSDMVTKITGGSYRPGFTHPDWEAALEALRPDAREYLQVRCGQAATGIASPDDALLFLHGEGANGKTTILTGLERALGSYAMQASPKLLESDAASTEFAALRGVRLLIAEEIQENHKLDMRLVKRLVGTPRVTARRLYKDNMTFTATHSLLTTGNFLPRVTETDHGTWRRLERVSFPYTFWSPDRMPIAATARDRVGDLNLRSRLLYGEDHVWDAVVTWLVEGALKWVEHGAKAIDTPRSVVADTTEWRGTADKVFLFWERHLTHDAGACVTKRDMWDAFNQFLINMRHAPWSEMHFHTTFASHESSHGLHEQRGEKNLTRSPVPDELRSDPFDDENETARPRVYVGVRFRNCNS